MRAELVIFDCDGVLVDSEAISLATELEFVERAGLTLDRATYMREFMGLPFLLWEAKIQARLLEQTGGQLPKVAFQNLRGMLDRALEERLTSLPGAREVCEAFAGRSCVASNSAHDRLLWKLRRTNLLDLVAPHVFSADLVASGKPSPDLFLLAAASRGVDPAACVVVEDSVHGVIAGKAAGMRVLGFIGGGHSDIKHAALLEAHGAERIVAGHDNLRSAVAGLSHL